MNKITAFLTTALAIFGFIAIGNAQFTEDFETDLSAWSQQGATNDNGDEWAITTLRAQSGVQSVYFNDFTGDHDRYLLSSPQDLSGMTAPLLTFSENINWSSYGLTHQALYSTDYSGDVTTATWNVLYDAIGAEDVWVEHSFSLPASVNVTIAFHYVGNYAAEWYIDDVSVAEAPSCAAPDNLFASGITTSGASLAWNETGTASEWEVDYGTSGYTPPINSTVTSNNPFNISGLTENTSYDFYVRSICGPGDTSEWTGPETFTTLAAPIIPDYLNAFSVVNGDAGPSFFPGELWSEASGTFADGPSGTISNWTVDNWLNAPGDTSAKINLYANNSNHWLISPDFDLSAGGLFLNLDAGVTVWNQTSSSAMGSDDEVHLLLSLDAGITWTSLYIWNAANTPSNTGTAMPTIDLSPFNGVVRFAIWASDGTNNDLEDYDFFIDNFSITGGTLCSDVSVTDSQVACDSYTWTDGNTYDASNYSSSTTISNETPGLFTTGPNTTWTNVYTACVIGDGNNGVTQTLEINIVSLPPGGANVRKVKTVANGSFNNGPAIPLTLGLNTLEVAAPAAPWGDRTVKFQFSDGAVEFDALSLNENSIYTSLPTQLLSTVDGCDSLVTLDLTFSSSISTTDVQEACDSYTWSDGNTYDASNYISSTTIADETPGLFTAGPNATWTNVYTACVIGDGNNGEAQTLEINILSLPPGGANVRKVKTVANGNFNNGPAIPLTLGLNTLDVAAPASPWGDRTVKFQFSDGAVEFNALSLNGGSVYSGAPQQLLTTTFGCDSLVTLELTLTNSSSSTDILTACDSYTWIDGNTYTESNNSATFTVQNAAGCDSIITLSLTISNSSESVDEQTACESYTWIDGIEYTESNDSATFTIQNAAGCDSTITLSLTITNSSESVDEQTACGPFTWIDGITYDEDNNEATFILQNVAGCDSTVTLDLEIAEIDTDVEEVDENTLEAEEDEDATYQWLDCNDNYAPIAGETNATFTTETSGDYAVEVSIDGCSDTSDCFTITSTVNIDDLNAQHGIQLFPNPTTNDLTISLEGIDVVDVVLLDIQGKVLMQQSGLLNQDTIDLSEYVTGTYFVKIITSAGSQEIRVIKQ